MEKIIDISRKISSNMVMWPGDDAPKISKKCSINKGDCCNLSSIEMNLHIGTHIDAPFHFIDGGKSISSLDLSYFIGNVKVFELDVENYIDKKDLINLDILKGDKIFFKTKNSFLPDDSIFYKDYVYINTEAARYLVEKQIKTVGIDYFSIGGYHKENEIVHKILLSSDIFIIEGLNLKEAVVGEYGFSCLPLYIEGVDGSPARGVLYI